jgi:hypothetical protein
MEGTIPPSRMTRAAEQGCKLTDLKITKDYAGRVVALGSTAAPLPRTRSGAISIANYQDVVGFSSTRLRS